MDKNFQIILKTAEQLAADYVKGGWTGDCNDFTQASSSISQELTNLEVERLWDEFANEELLANGVTFSFIRQGREKIIHLKKSE